jgi:hypothetical protein
VVFVTDSKILYPGLAVVACATGSRAAVNKGTCVNVCCMACMDASVAQAALLQRQSLPTPCCLHCCEALACGEELLKGTNLHASIGCSRSCCDLQTFALRKRAADSYDPVYCACLMVVG